MLPQQPAGEVGLMAGAEKSGALRREEWVKVLFLRRIPH